MPHGEVKTMPAKPQPIEYTGQFLTRPQGRICDDYIIYGLEHKKTAEETARLINFAKYIGRIKMTPIIRPDTLVRRAAKHGLVFPEFTQDELAEASGKKIRKHQGGRGTFNMAEMEVVDAAIVRGRTKHRTADQVATLLNEGGLLSREVSPRYVQNRSYFLKCILIREPKDE